VMSSELSVSAVRHICREVLVTNEMCELVLERAKTLVHINSMASQTSQILSRSCIWEHPSEDSAASSINLSCTTMSPRSPLSDHEITLLSGRCSKSGAGVRTPPQLVANRKVKSSNPEREQFGNSTVGSIVEGEEPPSTHCNSTLFDMVELVETSLGVHTKSNGSPSKGNISSDHPSQPCSSNNTATVDGVTDSCTWPCRSFDGDSMGSTQRATIICETFLAANDELSENKGEVRPPDGSSDATLEDEEYLGKETLGQERRFHRRSRSLSNLGSKTGSLPSRLQSLSRARSEFKVRNHRLANRQRATLERSALQLCRHHE